MAGLTDAQRAGGEADAAVVARWLDDGVAPSGARGRTFGVRGVHGFDLTFCAPKSVSLIRALRADEVAAKAFAAAHATALAEAMEYLAAHAGYTRVHNGVTGEKDLVRLPGVVAVAYQHEISRCGDPHLHTHVIVPNRQARADGQLVSIDGTSLYHEAKAAGVIYQATLRRELHRALRTGRAHLTQTVGLAPRAIVLLLLARRQLAQLVHRCVDLIVRLRLLLILLLPALHFLPTQGRKKEMRIS